jgi:hypothetical protein
MFFRHHLHYIYDIIHGEVDIDWNHDWGSILIVITFTLLTGFLLLLAWWMQDWCAASVWDHEDRWRGTKQFALTLLLVIYVPLLLNLLLFHIPIVHWLYFSRTFTWINLLVFYCYVVIWWIVLLPLAPTLALVFEWIDPRTRDPKRALLPWEQPVPPQPPEQTKRTKSRRKKVTTKSSEVTPQKRNKGIAEPSGELLLEEKVEREKQTQEDHQQLPLSASHEITPLPENRATTSLPSSESLSPKKPDKGKRESLKELF